MCKEIGLDGKQGVLIPERNMRHLMLSDEVIQAVTNKQFQIVTMNTIADGVAQLMGHSLNELNGRAESVLVGFKQILEANLPKKS